MPAPRHLVARINRAGDVNDLAPPRPLLSLEEFFEGDDHFGSIGCNLPNPPSPEEFYALLRQIRERPDVPDVVVEIKSHDDPDGWPFSDTFWVITSASVGQVRSWLSERVDGDEVFDGWTTYRPREPYHLPAGMRAVGVWYD